MTNIIIENCCIISNPNVVVLFNIAEETGLSRPSLYKALSEGAKPQFATIMKVLKALGSQIQINPIATA